MPPSHRGTNPNDNQQRKPLPGQQFAHSEPIFHGDGAHRTSSVTCSIGFNAHLAYIAGNERSFNALASDAALLYTAEL